MKATPITWKASSPTKMKYNSSLVSGAYSSANKYQSHKLDTKPKNENKEDLDIDPDVDITDTTEEGGGDGSNTSTVVITPNPGDEVEEEVSEELENLNEE